MASASVDGGEMKELKKKNEALEKEVERLTNFLKQSERKRRKNKITYENNMENLSIRLTEFEGSLRKEQKDLQLLLQKKDQQIKVREELANSLQQQLDEEQCKQCGYPKNSTPKNMDCQLEIDEERNEVIKKLPPLILPPPEEPRNIGFTNHCPFRPKSKLSPVAEESEISFSTSLRNLHADLNPDHFYAALTASLKELDEASETPSNSAGGVKSNEEVSRSPFLVEESPALAEKDSPSLTDLEPLALSLEHQQQSISKTETLRCDQDSDVLHNSSIPQPTNYPVTSAISDFCDRLSLDTIKLARVVNTNTDSAINQPQNHKLKPASTSLSNFCEAFSKHTLELANIESDELLKNKDNLRDQTTNKHRIDTHESEYSDSDRLNDNVISLNNEISNSIDTSSVISFSNNFCNETFNRIFESGVIVKGISDKNTHGSKLFCTDTITDTHIADENDEHELPENEQTATPHFPNIKEPTASHSTHRSLGKLCTTTGLNVLNFFSEKLFEETKLLANSEICLHYNNTKEEHRNCSEQKRTYNEDVVLFNGLPCQPERCSDSLTEDQLEIFAEDIVQNVLEANVYQLTKTSQNEPTANGNWNTVVENHCANPQHSTQTMKNAVYKFDNKLKDEIQESNKTRQRVGSSSRTTSKTTKTRPYHPGIERMANALLSSVQETVYSEIKDSNQMNHSPKELQNEATNSKEMNKVTANTTESKENTETLEHNQRNDQHTLHHKLTNNQLSTDLSTNDSTQVATMQQSQQIHTNEQLSIQSCNIEKTLFSKTPIEVHTKEQLLDQSSTTEQMSQSFTTERVPGTHACTTEPLTTQASMNEHTESSVVESTQQETQPTKKKKKKKRKKEKSESHENGVAHEDIGAQEKDTVDQSSHTEKVTPREMNMPNESNFSYAPLRSPEEDKYSVLVDKQLDVLDEIFSGGDDDDEPNYSPPNRTHVPAKSSVKTRNKRYSAEELDEYAILDDCSSLVVDPLINKSNIEHRVTGGSLQA